MGLPTAILFDLDDTLISAHLHPRKAWTKALQTVGGLPGDPTAEEAAVAIHTSAKWYWSDAERHRIGRLDILTARKTILTRAFTEIGWAQDDDFIDRLGRHFTEQRTNDTKLFPDAVETLDGLAQRGVRLGLITNGNAIEQRAKVDRFELARHFHHIQIEGEVGFGKPEEQAYAHALDKLGTSVEETWIIGDNLDWEVVVPQRLGFYAIWRDPIGKGLPEGSEAKPDRIVTRLAELLDP
ncbi:HAD family hydrolase [Thalassobaculum sp. OXR-137]|uniref:HAD family hydrolase n=1 Tax=Thalassobaculum sp. OXR-137 TaxID=3100173 RepID=UPI002AC9DB42|nr:HAD family hydrolase [Thalassobaculum sp. OXR-137]WPZ34196.1 HAD family hydrolase [Thalassobaculum sp. OXR-137]